MRIGPYEVLEESPIAGNGVDALARDEAGREVRLWLGAPGRRATPEAAEEARAALTSIFHTSLPRLQKTLVVDGRAVFVLAAYRGTTLAQRMAAGPVPAAEMLDITRGAAAGLVKAHRQGAVHGAVGPEEILLADDGRTLLLHLGLGPFLDPRWPRAPEDLEAPEPTESGDVFGLSRTLLLGLTGEDPFAGPDEASVRIALAAPYAPRDVDLPPELPEGLRRFLARAVRTDPTGRLHRAEEFSGDLGVIRSSWDSRARAPRKALPLAGFRLALAALAALLGAAAVLLFRSCGP